MKKYRFFSALLIVSLLFVLMPATAKAGMWDVPVAPGKTFRWVFVTSGTTNAESSEISYYNDFVNDIADAAGTTITGVVGKSSIAEIQWKAFASSGDVHAYQNISDLFSGAGVYNPLGYLIARETEDMLRGIRYPINVNQYGGVYNGLVRTGTRPDGFGQSGYTMGSYRVSAGSTWGGLSYWLSYPGLSIPPLSTAPLPLYAISEELTVAVVPAPGALILAATGLLPSALGLKLLRRKHQE
jgi:hypothetical protein